MEQKKYNDLQISAARELENMRMMKNQLAVQHSKERSEMQEKHSNEIHMFQKLIADLREYTKNGARSEYARNITIYEAWLRRARHNTR